jgi:hypothetical protein
MKKSFFYSFVLFIVGVFLIIACHKEKVDDGKNRNEKSLSETALSSGPIQDPCGSLSSGYCGGLQYQTKFNIPITTLADYPGCTFLATYEIRICYPNMDIKLTSFRDWPLCQKWQDEIDTLSSGYVLLFFLEFERKLIKEIITKEWFEYAPQIQNFPGFPLCSDNNAVIFSSAYHHSSCSKRCQKILPDGSYQIFTYWCGEGCCEAYFKTCIDDNNELVTQFVGSSATTGCNITWNPPCPDGAFEIVSCSATCDF